MNLVSSYLKDVLVISVISMLCELSLSGHSQHSGTVEKTLKFIISLCVFLTILFPFYSSLKSTDFTEIINQKMLIQSENTDNNTLIDLTKEQMEKQILQKICQQTGINPDDIYIELVIGSEKEAQNNFEICKINITLSQKHVKDAQLVKDTVESLFDNTMNVTINGEDNEN